MASANVVCVFGASTYSARAAALRLDELRRYGATNVVDSGLHRRADSVSHDVVARLRTADLIFLDGGLRELLLDALWATPALEAMIDASDDGAVTVGYSAGSEVLGAGCLSDWESGDEEEPLPLLGWLEEMVIQPHCYAPAIEDRLRRTIKAFPGSSGLCLAHGSAVLADRDWRGFRTIARGHGPSLFISDPNAPGEPLAAMEA